MDCNIPIYVFDMGIQLARILNVAMHAIYVTLVVRRPSAFRRTV
jgi:hypothetical protein